VIVKSGSQNVFCTSVDSRDTQTILKTMIPFSKYLPKKLFTPNEE